MKRFKLSLYAIPLAMVILVLGILLGVTAVNAYAPTTVSYLMRPGNYSSHIEITRWPETGVRGYAQGTTALSVGMPENVLFYPDFFEVWIETASDTWALDDTYTYTDTDSDGILDSFQNTLTSIDVLGGEYIIYTYKGV